MAKSKQAKSELLNNLSNLFKKAKSLVFADYTGLTMKDMQELRRAMRARGVEYEVTKKTLLRKSLESANITSVDVDTLQGMVSVAVSDSDEIEPAKQVVEFAKTHDKFKLLGGVIFGDFYGASQVAELAKLPGKDVLLARAVGAIKSPLSGFVSVLSGNLRGLVQVLSAISSQKK
ncbi:MAG: 50S ribosomal protein L10 [Patescibacteria group bacterium]